MPFKKPKGPGPWIKIIDTGTYPAQVVNYIKDQRKNQRRSGQDRRVSNNDRRNEWVSKVEPTEGKDGYYHLKGDRRKILNYIPKNGNFICITNRRPGDELRSSGERRGPNGIKPNYRTEPMRPEEHPEEPHGWRTMPGKNYGLRDLTKKGKGITPIKKFNVEK